MENFAYRHHSQSFIFGIVHFPFTLFWKNHQHSFLEKQVLLVGLFFFIDFQNKMEFQVLQSAIFWGATYSSASIAWSNSKLPSWFEYSGKLDGDSVSPYPRAPASAGWSAANAPFTKAYSVTFVWWWYASRQDFILGASLTQIETMFF